MVLQPEKSFIMGGSWRIPVLMKLLDSNFITDLKQDGTFNEMSFDREYESKWSGTAEDAFFNGDIFDRNRTLKQPEYQVSGRSSNKAYYILSMDVGRKGDNSVICVFKVTPSSTGAAIKSLVNIYSFADEHFEKQALFVKKLYKKYKAQAVVIDGNGLGIGLLDYMVKSQYDDETGDVYPDFGIINDEEGYYKKYRTQNTELDAIYVIKATAPINTEMHANAQTQMAAGKVKFLIDERVAKAKLLQLAKGKKMKPEQRNTYLRPFTLTSILKEEMLNLREDHEGVNIILKRVNNTIHKDKFSAFEYGLYYIKQLEDSRRKRRSYKISDMLFLN